MRDAVDPDGVDAGIAQHDLEGGARGRIALEHGSNILAHRFEHGAPSPQFAAPGRRTRLPAARALPLPLRATAPRKARPRRPRSSPPGSEPAPRASFPPPPRCPSPLRLD